MPGLSGASIVAGRRGGIYRHAPAVFKAAAKHVKRIGIAGLRCALKPGEGLCLIFCHPRAFQQHTRQSKLGFRQALHRRNPNPHRRLLWVAGQQPG